MGSTVNKNIQHNMKIIINIILVLLVLQVTWTKVEVRENIQDVVREMVVEVRSLKQEMKDMNDTFGKELKTKDDTIQKLERETNAKVVTLEQEVKNMKSKHDLLERELKIKDDMIKDMNETFGKELKTKDPPAPYSFFCGYKDLTAIHSATITYDSLLYSSTNIPDDATMDVETGIFTSGWGGTYTVTWSLYDHGNSNQRVDLYLRKNEEMIPESQYFSINSPSGYDQGGRSLLLRLERGETLDLWCKDCSAQAMKIIFCVTMSSFDFE